MSDTAPTPVRAKRKRAKRKLAPSLEVIVQTLIECLSDGSKIAPRSARLSFIFYLKSILESDAFFCEAFWRDATEWFDWYRRKCSTTLPPQNRFKELAKFPRPPVWNRKRRSIDTALTRALNRSRTVYGLADHVFASVLERCQQEEKLGRYMKAQRCFFIGKGGVVTGLVLKEWVQRSSKLTTAEKQRHCGKIQELFGAGDNDAAFYLDPHLDEKEFNDCVERFAWICEKTMEDFQKDEAWVCSIPHEEVPSWVEFDDEDCSGKVQVDLVKRTRNLKIVDGDVTPGRSVKSPVRVSDNLRIGGFALKPKDVECWFRLLRMKLLFHVRNLKYKAKTPLNPDERKKVYTAAAEIFDVGISLFRDHELLGIFQKLSYATTVPFGFPSRKRRRQERD